MDTQDQARREPPTEAEGGAEGVTPPVPPALVPEVESTTTTSAAQSQLEARSAVIRERLARLIRHPVDPPSSSSALALPHPEAPPPRYSQSFYNRVELLARPDQDSSVDSAIELSTDARVAAANASLIAAQRRVARYRAEHPLSDGEVSSSDSEANTNTDVESRAPTSSSVPTSTPRQPPTLLARTQRLARSDVQSVSIPPSQGPSDRAGQQDDATPAPAEELPGLPPYCEQPPAYEGPDWEERERHRRRMVRLNTRISQLELQQETSDRIADRLDQRLGDFGRQLNRNRPGASACVSSSRSTRCCGSDTACRDNLSQTAQTF